MLRNVIGVRRYWFESMGLKLLGSRYEPFKNLITGKRDGFCELALLAAFFRKQVSRGVMIDVGAQFGESFAPFAVMGWKVVAFEPDPNPRKRAAIAARKTTSVEVLHIAVSNEVGEVPFFVSPESTGVSTINPFLESHEKVTRVATDTLANILQARQIEQVDFLKIDTEGHDLFVLKGLDWDSVKPHAVLCEFDDRKTEPIGYKYQDMAGYLAEQGYAVYLSEWFPIERYGIQHQWRCFSRYPCELTDQAGWGNLIAIRTDWGRDFERLLDKRGVDLDP